MEVPFGLLPPNDKGYCHNPRAPVPSDRVVAAARMRTLHDRIGPTPRSAIVRTA
ncbi:MAG: hypothetical protein QGH76_01375 [Phycisphaerales bacterium]|nr:hypothetical protein [Phycisphaerales bacterium]